MKLIATLMTESIAGKNFLLEQFLGFIGIIYCLIIHGSVSSPSLFVKTGRV